MPSSRPLDRLRDVVENCDRIARHIDGMDLDGYLADEKTRDAVERCLSRISEAAYKIGDYVDALYPNARWKAARGVGNPLRHKYDEIEDAEIWDGVIQSLPAIRESALTEIARLEAELHEDHGSQPPHP